MTLINHVNAASSAIVAAFDCGSGRFKLQVASMEGGQFTPIYSNMAHVELGLDFAANHTLSDRIQKAALEALNKLKQEAEAHGATRFQGIATAIFRKADNGEVVLQQLVDATSIRLETILPEQEGILGFRTVRALLPEIDEEQLVAWDSGNASFQMVAKEASKYMVYEGPWGNSSVVKTLVERVRKCQYQQKSPVNPIKRPECEELSTILQKAMSEVPQWLSSKLQQHTVSVVAFGDKETIFGVAAKHLGKTEFSDADVASVIDSMVDKPPSHFTTYITMADPETALPGEILLSAVMKKTGIHKISYKESIGSTPGMLISPEIWK